MPTLCDSYSESNYSTSVSLNAGATSNSYYGQSFTGNGGVLNSAKFYLSKDGSPTGNITAEIFAHNGTFGTSSSPTGSALAVSDNYDVSTITTLNALRTFTFSGANKITLTNGTYYVLVIHYYGGDSSNDVDVGCDSSSPSHGGNYCYYFNFNSTWYYDSGTDLLFYVYTDASSASPSVSPSSSLSPSSSPSPSLSPSLSPSASLSPSPSPSPSLSPSASLSPSLSLSPSSSSSPSLSPSASLSPSSSSSPSVSPSASLSPSSSPSPSLSPSSSSSPSISPSASLSPSPSLSPSSSQSPSLSPSASISPSASVSPSQSPSISPSLSPSSSESASNSPSPSPEFSYHPYMVVRPRSKPRTTVSRQGIQMKISE